MTTYRDRTIANARHALTQANRLWIHYMYQDEASGAFDPKQPQNESPNMLRARALVREHEAELAAALALPTDY